MRTFGGGMIVLVMLTLLGVGPPASATTYNQVATDDGYTAQIGPKSALPTGDSLGPELLVEWSGSEEEWYRKSTVMRFDLGTIPDTAVITSAKLYLNVKEVGSDLRPAQVYRTSDSWHEGDWSDPKTCPAFPLYPPATTGPWPPATMGWLEFDLLPWWDPTEDLTDDALSLLMCSEELSPGNLISFWSRNSGEGGPRLQIEYGVIPEPLTMLGMFLGVCGVGAYVRKRVKAHA